jgi:primase-polymerase (primpol)-like protein
MKVDIVGIPKELKDVPNWVGWIGVNRAGKMTKIPVTPETGEKASSTNPETWSTFAQAWLSYRKAKFGIMGIGYVFSTDDPFVGVDLDGCIDYENRRVKTWARDIVSELGSYTEFSPSRTGLHVICKGEIPGDRRRNGPIEMYSDKRFFTITGDLFDPDATHIEHSQDGINSVYGRVFPKREMAETRRLEVVHDISDVLTHFSRADVPVTVANLWKGDWRSAGFPSQSEADLALCSYMV